MNDLLDKMLFINMTERVILSVGIISLCILVLLSLFINNSNKNIFKLTLFIVSICIIVIEFSLYFGAYRKENSDLNMKLTGFPEFVMVFLIIGLFILMLKKMPLFSKISNYNKFVIAIFLLFIGVNLSNSFIMNLIFLFVVLAVSVVMTVVLKDNNNEVPIHEAFLDIFFLVICFIETVKFVLISQIDFNLKTQGYTETYVALIINSVFIILTIVLFILIIIRMIGMEIIKIKNKRGNLK